MSFVLLVRSLGDGKMADLIGRKWTMGLASVVFQARKLIIMLARSFEVLMEGRLLSGIGAGFELVAAIVYIDLFLRDLHQLRSIARLSLELCICGPSSKHRKVMLGVGILPSVFLGVALFIIPVSEMTGDAKPNRRCSVRAFKDAGIKGTSNLLAATIAIGMTKTIFILITIVLIDKPGPCSDRQACPIHAGVSLSLHIRGRIGAALAILSICGNVAFFSIWIRPIFWVLNSEIFPLRLRALVVALGSIGNRVCSGLITMSFLSMARSITVCSTFLSFFMLSALSLGFVYALVPETKGRVGADRVAVPRAEELETK